VKDTEIGSRKDRERYLVRLKKRSDKILS